MSKLTIQINKFFKQALKKDIVELENKIIFTDRQYRIYTDFYVKRIDINTIAYDLGVSPMVVNKELKNIRNKISKVI